MPAAMKPTMRIGRKAPRFGISRRSGRLKMPAASMMGMDMRKAKRAAAGRSKLRVMPPVMVEPEREMPGKIEKAWNTPIQSASFQFIFSSWRERRPKNSAAMRKMAVMKRKNAVILGSLNTASTLSLRKTPAKPAGIVASTRYQPIRASCSTNGLRWVMPITKALMMCHRSFQK